MASFVKRGKNWYFRFVDASGKQVMRRGCPDRRVTEQLARNAETEAAKIRNGEIDTRDIAIRDHNSRPITEHLADFEVALVSKGNGKKYAQVTRYRVARVLKDAGIRKLSEMSLSRVQEALGKLRDDDLSIETINHHVRAVKGFSRWLRRDQRTREHVLADLATSNSEPDRRRVRRALTDEEAAKLIRTTEQGKVRKNLSGPDRAMLYRLAMGTGFRANELRTLTPEVFHLTGDAPQIVAKAAYTKNGKSANQPISRSLADLLRPWLGTKEPGKPVFGKLTARTGKMIALDLKAAEIEPETEAGVADFHSLRNFYISRLVSKGVSIKVAQTLARHSTPTLTLGIYAKASASELHAAVERLPDLDGKEKGKGSQPKTGGRKTSHK